MTEFLKIKGSGQAHELVRKGSGQAPVVVRKSGTPMLVRVIRRNGKRIFGMRVTKEGEDFETETKTTISKHLIVFTEDQVMYPMHMSLHYGMLERTRAPAKPKIKGWSQAEAEDRVRLHKMAQTPFSETVEHVEFDAQWGEWVIVTRRPGEPTTMQRKPRGGLALSSSWRVVDDQPPVHAGATTET